MEIMTGGGSTSIQISYSTDDGGIATEELIGFDGSEFLAEVEEVEEYRVAGTDLFVSQVYPVNTDKTIQGRQSPRSIALELKMVTLIPDKGSEGVRIVRSDSESPTPPSIRHLSDSSAMTSAADAQTEVERAIASISPQGDSDDGIPLTFPDAQLVDELPAKPLDGLYFDDEEIETNCSSPPTPTSTTSPVVSDNDADTNDILYHDDIIGAEFTAIGTHCNNNVLLEVSDVDAKKTIELSFPSNETTEHMQESILCKQTMGEEIKTKKFRPVYDGPPVLSPIYGSEAESRPTNGVLNLSENDDEETLPPSLTLESSLPKEFSFTKPEKSLKRKRNSRPSSKKPKRAKKETNTYAAKGESTTTTTTPKADLSGNLPNKKAQIPQHKEYIQHKEIGLHSLIPHSSAEIQERVKNRKRKTIQSYGCVMEVVRNGNLADPDYAIAKNGRTSKSKRNRRKRSLESARTEQNRRGSKPGLFIVEKILRKGLINGRPYFFVKWLNYPNSKNTWEPEENFSLDLIVAYEQNLAESGQQPPVEEVVDPKTRVMPRPPSNSVVRNRRAKKEQCPGCLAYPITFSDNRTGVNGFEQGLTYHKIYESFILDEERCALVEFDEKHCLELLPLYLINDKLKDKIKLY